MVTRGERYVQGGGCTSVGIGGHVQTGGFGSFSKYGGLVAAALLEPAARPVLADALFAASRHYAVGLHFNKGLAGATPKRRAETQETSIHPDAELRKVAPASGSSSSEMRYFEAQWQARAWGPHYGRLLATKRKYDPDGLFTGHHQVGSELWSVDGFTRRS